MKHPEVYQHLGMSPPRGFLLHGPPVCGKTLLAHAIAGVSLQLLHLKCHILNISLCRNYKSRFFKEAAPELPVSGVSGESEEQIRFLFEQATSSAPCIISHLQL
jgi:ribosome biogenesis ATPase